MLLQVPHHLVELVLRDLAARVPGPEDCVRIISVPPVAASAAVPTPAPAAPPSHSPEKEEEQEEEDPAKPEEREEDEPASWSAERVGGQGRRNHQADDHEEADDGPREGPSGNRRRGHAHARPPPSTTAMSRRAIFSIASRCGCNFDTSEVFKSSRYDTNPSISLNISSIPCGRRRPTPGIHSNSSRTFGFSSYRPSSRFWTSPSCCSSARSG